MIKEDYKNQDVVDLVVERVMIKSQITSLIRETKIDDLPKLSESSELKNLYSKKTSLEEAIYNMGAYNERHIDLYEKSLYERGLIWSSDTEIKTII